MKFRYLAVIWVICLSSGLNAQPGATFTSELDSIKSVISKASNFQEKVDLSNKMVREYFRYQPDSILFYTQPVLTESIENNYLQGIVEGRANIAVGKAKSGDTDEGLKVAYRNKSFADSIGGDAIRQAGLYALSEIYFGMVRIDSMIKYHKESLTIAERVGDSRGLLMAYNNMGISFAMKGYHELGLKYFLKASRVNEELGEDPLWTFRLIMNIGNLYNVLEEGEKTLVYRKKLYEISRSSSDSSKHYIALGLMGEAYYLVGDYQNSIIFIDQALNKFKESGTGAKNMLNLLYFYRGESYRVQKNWPEAIASYKKAIKYGREYYGEDYRGSSDLELADTYSRLGRTEEAYDLIVSTLEQAEITGDEELEKHSYYSLSIYDSVRGDNESYIRHYLKFTALKDTIEAYQTKTAIAQMDIEYQTELKNKEIALLQNENEAKTAREQQILQLRNALIIGAVLLLILSIVLYNRYQIKSKSLSIINDQKQDIEKKVDENSRLVQEMHHRIKNNLQIIISLLNAQTNLLQEDSNAVEVIQESQNRIKSLSLIHEDLLKSDHIDEVSAPDYFINLIENIKSSLISDVEKIKIVTDIAKVNIKMSLAVPLGLILNELITNSFKYAFQGMDNGTIEVFFGRISNSQYYSLKISDDGIGAPSHVISDSPDTFGLQLVQGLTQQMMGNMKIENSKGTLIDIKIKIDDVVEAA